MVILTVGEARRLADGSHATVRGRLTTPVGLIDSGRGAFLEDGGAGLAVYLETGTWPAVVPGDDLVVRGAIETRNGQLTLDVATAQGVVVDGHGPLPNPLLVATGLVCEPFEGRVVSVEGVVVAADQATEEGIQTSIDDGSGALIVLAPAASGVSAQELKSAFGCTWSG